MGETKSQTLRIMPMGNSITQGYIDGNLNVSERISYRKELYTLLNSGGYDFDFVGSETAGWNFLDDYDHAGWPGIRDNELADIMETGYTVGFGYQSSGPYMESNAADIILLHIGTNDIWAGNTDGAASVERILNAIDDYETTTGNSVLVLLARVISTSDADNSDGGACTHNNTVNTYNNNVISMAQDRINNQGDKIVIVDMQCSAGLNYYTDMENYAHPKQTGYDKMANYWFQVIDNINKKPQLTQIPEQNINEGQSFNSINLDTYISDVESSDDQIRWSIIQEPGAELSFNITPTRQLTASTPSTDWSGSETIQLIAADAGNYIEALKKYDTIHVVFNVNPVNDPPVILTQLTTYTINEDSSLELLVTDFNIEDTDSDPIDIELIVSEGVNYTAVGNTITPTENYFGTLSVNVQCFDQQDYSEDFTAEITVNPVPDAPIILGVSSNVSVNEDEELTLQLSDLLVDDPDNTFPTEHELVVYDGDNFDIVALTNLIIPDTNYNGQITVPVKVRDASDLESEFYYLDINVIAVNDPPYFLLPENSTAHEGEYYEATIEVRDVDDDVVTNEAIVLPNWLSFNPTTNVISGTPTKEDIDDTSVVFRASDGIIEVETDFNISVVQSNYPPEILSSPITSATVGETYSYGLSARDQENDPLSYFEIALPDWLTFYITTKVLIGTPDESDKGDNLVHLAVTDGIDTTEQQFILHVDGLINLSSFSAGNNDIILYPNPSGSGFVYIEFGTTVQHADLKLFNLEGNMVLEKQCFQQELISIDLHDQNIPKGIYLISVKLDNRNPINFKLIVN